jgi:hypothetical protein
MNQDPNARYGPAGSIRALQQLAEARLDGTTTPRPITTADATHDPVTARTGAQSASSRMGR